MRKFVLTAIVLSVLVAVLGNLPSGTRPAVNLAAPTREPEVPDLVISEAREKLKCQKADPQCVGMVPAMDMISRLERVGAQSPDAAAMIPEFAAIRDSKARELEKVRQKQLAEERKRLENDSPGRADYARRMEERFLKDFRDVDVRALGTRNTTLQIKYVLIGRPFVYNAVNKTRLTQEARAAGFKLIVFTDGYRSSWSYDLVKDDFR